MRWRCTCFCGIWGTLAVGLFATGQYGIPGAGRRRHVDTAVKGLFYGGGPSQLKAQFIGSLTCVVVVGGVALHRDVRHQDASRAPGTCGSTGTPSSRASTSSSTALPAYHMEFGQGMTYTSAGGFTPSVPSSIGAPPSSGPSH